MQLNLKDMEQQENDPSSGRNNVISPEEVETSLDAEEVQIEDELLDEGEEDTILDENDGVDFGNNEISVLNSQLDQLQSALDAIESRNENIHKELLEILYSNREVRQTISAENQKTEGTTSDSVEQESLVSAQVQALLLEKTNQMGNETKQLISKLNDVTDSLQKL